MLVHWFIKCQCSLLPSSVWLLPIHGPNIPGFYAILLFVASDFTSITRHIHSWCWFCFGSVPSFFLALFILSSSVASWHLLPRGVHLSVSNLCAFSYCSLGHKVRILKWFAIPFCSGPHFVRTLHHDLSILGGPTVHGSWFCWIRWGCDPCNQFD